MAQVTGEEMSAVNHAAVMEKKYMLISIIK